MKLIKLQKDHFVVVDDSEIKDWYVCWETINNIPSNHIILQATSNDSIDMYSWASNYKKITHSTQPLEGVLPINLSEIKSLIGEVDVEKLAKYYYGENRKTVEFEEGFIKGFNLAYNQCLEDNKEKKYTEGDLREAIKLAQSYTVDTQYDEYDVMHEILKHTHSPDMIIQSLQPKSEWEVGYDVNGKLKLV